MKSRYLTSLAFLTATASVIYIVESLIFRMLPLPFLRLGLSNIVVLYLVWNRRIFSAVIVNLAKSIVGGVATFTLLSPTVILSVSGGFIAVLIMSAGLLMRPRFSLIGISILGAISHNLTQLVLARYLIITNDSLFVLTPILILFGLISGIITAYISYYLEEKIPALKASTWKKEKDSTDSAR
ncbi:MAG: Gx transporter family protein [Candidatus Cloacimonadaceae bacterium]|jgi:heptaprenyl diphosphate synthase|nr:Gx transporter family protein [Candidatus Cloacimonadota bacterium]MDY0127087.1 Gx transporter family protein [Candidatus Cloacimonadaceae bacterium]MCB5255696.1 Gx transporter family protein [Candidatus Cloacimonadota bacterium]MCK9177770.1 Gx transporter family protein [Candidatus Cloacimonadota bacterium]MCK9241756.1 Gx transporter family protein [Candidatus Cloacimonadota bacterium]